LKEMVMIHVDGPKEEQQKEEEKFKLMVCGG
jgi:hypothetical protein